jgi:hypothetical protein
MITAKDGKTRPPPEESSRLEDAANFPCEQDTATVAPLPPITLISSLSTDSRVGEQDHNVDASATAYTDLILGDETWANAISQNSELDGFENGTSGLPESDIEWTEWTGEVDLTTSSTNDINRFDNVDDLCTDLATLDPVFSNSPALPALRTQTKYLSLLSPNPVDLPTTLIQYWFSSVVS